MPVDLHALYSVPPAEFVAARTALVAALKAERRKEEAVAVQQLRRPRLAEHALNAAARSEPRVVERWVHAVTAADVAQSTAIGGGGAEALRDAAGELREAHAAVLAAAVSALGDGGAAQRADINDALRALAHPEGAPLLQNGVVGSEQVGNLALFAGAPEPVVRRSVPHATPSPREPVEEPPPEQPPTTQPASKIDLRALRALERTAASAHSESERADAELSVARAALAAAKDAVAAATTAAAQARADVRSAEEAVAALRDQAR